MSETTPIRTSKDLVNCFDIQRTDEVKLENFIEDVEELQHKQSIPSYQEWRDNLMTEDINEIIESSPAVLLQMPQSKFTKTSMKSEKTAKTVTSAELVLRHSPQKIKNFAHMPLMSSASKSKIANKAKEMEQYSSNKQASVSKLKTNEASHLKRDSANTKSGSKIKTIQLETEVVGLQDFIKQVQDNKEAISSKKQKLRDLEEQIVSISDKMVTTQSFYEISKILSKNN